MKGEELASYFICCTQDTGPLTPTAPMAVRLWETFTFYSYDLLDKNARVNNVDIDQIAACQTALRHNMLLR